MVSSIGQINSAATNFQQKLPEKKTWAVSIQMEWRARFLSSEALAKEDLASGSAVVSTATVGVSPT
jgi:hypothetical protein